MLRKGGYLISKEIKTKSIVKDVKVLDKAADLGAHMKSAYIRTKESAEATQDTGHSSPSEYASEAVSNRTRELTQEAVHEVKNKLKHSHKDARNNMNKAKEHFGDIKKQFPAERRKVAEQAKQTAEKAKQTADRSSSHTKETHKTVLNTKKAVIDAKQKLYQTRQASRQTIKTAKQSTKNVKHAEKTIKTSVKSIKATGKGTIKTAKNSVKTAEITAKNAVKTAKQTAKAAQKSAQAAVKVAKTAAQTSKAAANTAVESTKAAIKATTATVKAAIAATKGLIMLILAGGWIAVLIIIIICMIGCLVSSSYGVFLSGEDSGNGIGMSSVIAEINQEYTDKIAKIKNDNPHDEVKMSGSRATWKEILAVYAVKTSNDSENAQDVVLIDKGKKEILRAVFWKMNAIEHKVKKENVKEITVTDDRKGKLLETEKTVKKTILYITVSGKTASELAVQYGFNQTQKAQLDELLSKQYDEMWNAVLYGVSSDGTDIVAIAASQIGNVGGQQYWSWYGFDNRVEWCACFASWCADQCGYIEAGVLPKFAACTSQGAPWFKERGLWMEAGNTPKPGDLIFLSWDHDDVVNHVGIVEYVEGDFVHTIEGNSGDAVEQQSYGLDSADIKGYGMLCA